MQKRLLSDLNLQKKKLSLLIYMDNYMESIFKIMLWKFQN